MVTGQKCKAVWSVEGLDEGDNRDTALSEQHARNNNRRDVGYYFTERVA